MRMSVRRLLMTADVVGGVWPYTVDLAQGYAARGIAVDVAVMGPPASEAQRQEIAAAGARLHELPCRLEWMDDPWRDVDGAGGALLDLARATRADLVHLNGFCHAALPWPAPVAVVAHSCVRSWWRAVHGEAAPGRFDEYSRRVEHGLRAASVVIAPSAAMLRELEREYGVPARGRVIPNGRAALSTANEIPREPIVFTAGRLWDEAKNVEAVCAVAPHLSWPVFVAGDTRAPDGRTIAPAGARYLGRLGAPSMTEWYARASIYALPARYEPFGLSVLEAARAGCALVLGDIRSLRENWNGAAVFVPPDNRRALASAIQALSADDGRRRELSTLAVARAARFTVDRMVAGYLDAYAALVSAEAA
jgi:glycosyltransferase involved in cell wall biosynthesis